MTDEREPLAPPATPARGGLRGLLGALRRALGGAPRGTSPAAVRAALERELDAVLHGLRAYERLAADEDGNRFLLRRNTHRLEKGLLMRPRREVFARDYIEETVEVYARLLGRRGERAADPEELRWTHDVLEEYFSVIGAAPEIERARERFADLAPLDAPAGARPSHPYRRDLDGPPPVAYEDFLALARRRRSVRWFRPEPVPRELVDRALVAAFEAPSACNRQPFEFRVVDDPHRVERVSAIARGTRGFAHNIPTLVVVVGQLRAFFHPRDRHVIYIDASLAAMGFMLALETVGLSSCPINWPDVAERERRMARVLDLAPDERPVMLLAVGYPDPEGAVACSQKQSLERLRAYDRP